MTALKYDADKLPWDLLPFKATEGMLRVLLYGARKYTICGTCNCKVYKNPRLQDLGGEQTRDDCPGCGSTDLVSGMHNWRKGFKWTRLIASSFRHLVEIAKGIDYDPESGELHANHLACCVAFLSEHIQDKLGKDDRYKFNV